jgi:endo-1,4-beta-xylanase
MEMKIIRLFLFIYISVIIIQSITSKIEITENKSDLIDDYFYRLWNQDIGSVRMTLENKHTFNCSWKSIQNAVFTLGKEVGNDGALDNINLDNITVNFDAELSMEGNSYISIYTYFDFYWQAFIVDNWSLWRPKYGVSKGTVTIDDGIYDIYYNEVTNPPNIHGIAKTKEFWSVRREKRSKGSISVGEHLKIWKKNGLDFTNIHSIAFQVEAYQSSGTANVNNVEISINEK